VTHPSDIPLSARLFRSVASIKIDKNDQQGIMTAPRYVLARRPGFQLDVFAMRCGLHPELVRRLVALGLVRCHVDARGEPWFEPSALATVARIQRLRTGLGLNYAVIGVALDLLDRIDELESASRRRRTSLWTSTS
jgi:chaperone modulatory protein CbpM